MIQNKIINSIPVLFLFFVMASCGPSKKVHEDRLYLRGIDSAKLQSLNIPEAVIQKGDLLSIKVYSDNADATSIFNQTATGGATLPKTGEAEISGSTNSSSPSVGPGYMVDVKGNIRFQKLGLMHIEGLTKDQLSNLLIDSLSRYLTNPYVEIRFLNARVTILGEIARPGIINIPEQKISLLDAIALSGDLTGYGRRDNILVIREKNGKRETARLDIRSPSIYQSEYFYLQQNDFVYVEPIRKKPSGSDNLLLRNVTIATSIISSLAILISLFR